MAISTASRAHPRRKHAVHNEEVCCYLEEKPGFGDWVMTTAFYSALHWLQYRIFPLTMQDGTVIDSFDSYKIWSDRNGGLISSHHILIELASRHHSEIASRYRRLYSACLDVRYKDFQPAPSIVRTSVKDMQMIRAYCDNR